MLFHEVLGEPEWGGVFDEITYLCYKRAHVDGVIKISTSLIGYWRPNASSTFKITIEFFALISIICRSTDVFKSRHNL